MTPADYDRLLTVIRALLDRQARVIAAIDGRCGAGKSTLAAQLQAQLSCRVFHMDDFFLRPEQRTAARLAQPGENVDHERFLSEVLQPALRGEAVTLPPLPLCAAGAGRAGDGPGGAPDHRGGRLRLPSGPVGQLRPAGIPYRGRCRAAPPH